MMSTDHGATMKSAPDLRVRRERFQYISLQSQTLISQCILRYLFHLSETILTMKRICFLPYLLHRFLGETKCIHLINSEHCVYLALL